jgi:hypothetical protein
LWINNLAYGTGLAICRWQCSPFLEVAMRVITFATAPLLVALMASPAQAQISARIHIDIPIGRRGPVIVHRAPAPRAVVVLQYDARRFGDWRRDARKWSRITLYYRDGRYYDQPWSGARAVAVYRYRNQYFFAPRDRGWDRAYGRDFDRDDGRGNGRGIGRNHGRDDGWNYGRDDGRHERQAPRPDTRYQDRARPRF